MESHRFKTASVVKIHKLGAVSGMIGFNKRTRLNPFFHIQLVQFLKDVRSKAYTVLKTMSNDLLKMSEVAGSAERRKSFVESCKPITDFPRVGMRFRLSDHALTLFISCIMTLCSVLQRTLGSRVKRYSRALAKEWSRFAPIMASEAALYFRY